METPGNIRSIKPRIIDAAFAIIYRAENLLDLLTMFLSGEMSFSFCSSNPILILLSISLSFSWRSLLTFLGLRLMSLLYFLDRAWVYFDSLARLK